MSDAIVFDRVGFAYPDAAEPVLTNATFSVPEGAFVLVAGATGAGKSTLLRAVDGLVPHFTGGTFAGRVEVMGRDTLSGAPRDLADVVGFVPQDPTASFVLDRVEDELAYAMENLGLERSTMRRRVEETLDLLDIEPLRGREVRSLSGGERQRVAIAAAMTTAPRVLVLDEPTSQLDPQGAEDVLAALQRLVHDHGITVLVAEHRLERIAGFVDLAIACRTGASPVLDLPGPALESLGAGPPVARLGRLLGWTPAPLTVREARRRAAEVPALGGIRGPGSNGRGNGHGQVLVRAERLEAGYGARAVLTGIDLELRAGEVAALMGRNGAGKTTLLRCLSGLHAPGAGRVGSGAGPPRPGVDVALCPQEPESLLFRERVVDEIAVTARRGPARASATEIVAALGLDGAEDRHPRDLSAGERLLVALGAVVATGAPVLLLDEATRGLDPETKLRLTSFLRGSASEGRAVLFATHDVELVAALADRVVMIAGGEVIADGPPGGVLGDSTVFAPQMTRVFGPGWLTPEQVAAAMPP
jgi:energy-coupling factor transport system ATP-binding protein